MGIPAAAAAAAAMATAALAAMPGERAAAGSAAVAAVSVSASLLVASGTADNDADDDGVLLLRAAAIAGGFAAFAAVAARAAAEPSTGWKSLRGRGTGPVPVGYNFTRFLLQPFWRLLRLLGTKQKDQTKGNMNCCKKKSGAWPKLETNGFSFLRSCFCLDSTELGEPRKQWIFWSQSGATTSFISELSVAASP